MGSENTAQGEGASFIAKGVKGPNVLFALLVDQHCFGIEHAGLCFHIVGVVKRDQRLFSGDALADERFQHYRVHRSHEAYSLWLLALLDVDASNGALLFVRELSPLTFHSVIATITV